MVNERLSAAFKQYGTENFKFELLEIVLPQNLTIRELYWISNTDCCDPSVGYNCIKYPTGNRNGGNTKIFPAMVRKFGTIIEAEVARLTQIAQ